MGFWNRLILHKNQVIQLNGVAIFMFALFCILQGFPLSEEVMFFSADSKGYLEVANWIFSDEETNYLIKRPLLYPLVVGLPYQLFGIYGIWGIQALCWLSTVNFLFFGVKKWTGKSSISWLVAVLFLLNFSLMALTFHAITEIVTTTLLAYFFYFIVSNRKKRTAIYFIHGVLIILIALTLVKPLFFYPTLICLIFLPFFYFKRYRQQPKSLIFLALIFLPLLFQMSLVKVKYGAFKVSIIGKDTFNNYYFAKTVREIDGLEIDESIVFANALASSERISYMQDNAAVFVHQFFENIELNIKGEPVYLDIGIKDNSAALFEFMSHYNRGTFLFHILGLLSSLITIVFTWRKKKYDTLVPILFLSGLSTYFIVTSGISFWQGDRLVVPAISLWAPLYMSLLSFRIGMSIPLEEEFN